MYYSEIGKIIEAGLEGDKERVKSFALLLATKLKEDGETRGSERIVNIIEKRTVGRATTDSLVPPPVDQESRMSIANIDYSPKSEELVLSDSVRSQLKDFIETILHKDEMYEAGLEFSQSLLLYGQPGCGKTSAASLIAAEMHLPLITARLDTLISSLLGATAKNIHKIFDYAKRQPCVLFLDEFDAIAKARDDQHELGELKRVVNSLLQNIDEYCCGGILIAATNHHEMLDSAIWRRFQTVIEMPLPGVREIEQMMGFVPKVLDLSQIKDTQWNRIYSAMEGLSYSDIKAINNNLAKKAILCGNYNLGMDNIVAEIYLFKKHGNTSKDDMAEFMLRNGVPKNKVIMFLGISRRTIDQIAGRIEIDE